MNPEPDFEEYDEYDENSYVPLKIPERNSKLFPKRNVILEHFYEPIHWSLFFQQKQFLPNGTNYYATSKLNETIFLCFHGAGHSALVFGQLAKQIRNQAVLVAYDLLQHGDSTSTNQLTIQNLVSEGIYVFEEMYKKYPGKYVLLGHSLGGSIATRVAEKMNNKQIVGVVMIDTIEGAALKAKKQMIQFLTQRPKEFRSLQSAIHWHIKAGCLRRNESARCSIPSQLKKKGEKFTWKTDVLSTNHLWEDWFKGLSQKYLNLKCKKLLMTSSKFRLDETLLKGLQNSLFEISLFEHSGHSIQEDEYEKVGRILIGEFVQE